MRRLFLTYLCISLSAGVAKPPDGEPACSNAAELLAQLARQRAPFLDLIPKLQVKLAYVTRRIDILVGTVPTQGKIDILKTVLNHARDRALNTLWSPDGMSEGNMKPHQLAILYLAHDFKNSLSFACALVDQIAVNQTNPQRDLLFENVKNQIEFSQRLLSQIERTNEHTVTEAVETISLREFFHSLQSLITVPATHRLSFGVPDADLAMRGRRTDLTRMIQGLVANAVEAKKSGSDIHIKAEFGVADNTRMQGEFLVISVTDNGPGLPTDYNPFSDSGKSTSIAEGVNPRGIGMNSFLMLLEDNGGILDWHSTNGQGTEFELMFPRLVSGLSQADEKELAIRPRSNTVLFVDDNPRYLGPPLTAIGRMNVPTMVVTSSRVMEAAIVRFPGLFRAVVMDQKLSASERKPLAERVEWLRVNASTLPVFACSMQPIPPSIAVDGVLSKPFDCAYFVELLDQIAPLKVVGDVTSVSDVAD